MEEAAPPPTATVTETEKDNRAMKWIAIAVVAFLFLYVATQQNDAGFDGATYSLTKSDARKASAVPYSECYSRGLDTDPGDINADGGKILYEKRRLNEDSIVFINGGDTEGLIVDAFRETYKCKVFLFEGHPDVYASLVEKYREANEKETVVHIFNFLLGKEDHTVKFSDDMTAEVKAVGKTVRQMSVRQIDLLHIDCGGCEYELLEYLVKETHRIQEIQVHVTSGVVDDYLARYCHVQEELSADFKLSYRYPFTFESWVRK